MQPKTEDMMHQRINVSLLTFGTAQKTANIRAKPLAQVINDPHIFAKLTLETLEGQQAIQTHAGVFVCIGEALDYWQQDGEKLFKSYDVINVDDQGWLTCKPKPEAERNFTQIPEEIGEFEIPAQWGKKLSALDRGPQPVTLKDEELETLFTYEHVQFGKPGDYVLQSQEDPFDFWIVKKALFENTYQVKTDAPAFAQA